MSKVVVAGSLCVDRACDFSPEKTDGLSADKQPLGHTSNPSIITATVGGVGYNVACTAHSLYPAVTLHSIVADDVSGQFCLSAMRRKNLATNGVKVLLTSQDHRARTGEYVAFNDTDNQLVVAMADIGILETFGRTCISDWLADLKSAQTKVLVVDANWDPETLRTWIRAGRAVGAEVVYEPVSSIKSRRLFHVVPNAPPLTLFPRNEVDIATPNSVELAAMHSAASASGLFRYPEWQQVMDAFGLSGTGLLDRLAALTPRALHDEGVVQKSIDLLPFVPCVLTTLGEGGVLQTELLHAEDDRLVSAPAQPHIIRPHGGGKSIGGILVKTHPPKPLLRSEIVSVNGAGDTFVGALAAGLASRPRVSRDESIAFAQDCSRAVLREKASTPSEHVIAELLGKK